LQENIDIGFNVSESQFLLSILAARRGRLAEAHAHLAEAMGTVSPPENNSEKANRLEAEAELALAEGRWDQAVSAFQTRVDLWQAGGYRWRWARDLIRLGDVFRQRGEPGDPQRAREAYQGSLAMFTEMNAPGYIAALQSRLEDF
jgi:tetratricopeptide (TPR) repeat protein